MMSHPVDNIALETICLPLPIETFNKIPRTYNLFCCLWSKIRVLFVTFPTILYSCDVFASITAKCHVEFTIRPDYLIKDLIKNHRISTANGSFHTLRERYDLPVCSVSFGIESESFWLVSVQSFFLHKIFENCGERESRGRPVLENVDRKLSPPAPW